MLKTSRYGWQRDSLDHRNYKLATPSHPLGLKSSDLRPLMPPVYDQGQTSSCLAQAIAAAIQYERARLKLPVFIPSRLFIYYNARAMENTVNQPDAGGQIKDGIKGVASLGAPPESDWPFSEDGQVVSQLPSQKAFSDAKTDLVTRYATVEQTTTGVLSALTSGFPVIFGASVFQQFESLEVASSGVVPFPSSTDAPIGGHAMLIVGAQIQRQMFIVRNSWGDLWGDKGYAYFPFGYLLNQNLASDFWTIAGLSRSSLIL